jgi:glycosyltransferase involved in cell wall biosynthesis
LKIFTLAPRENWVCDRFVSEWNNHNKEIVSNPEDADIIWLLADWCWNHMNLNLLKSKTVIASVHHIVPEKFSQQDLNVFNFRDRLIDYYHVPCLKTRDQIKDLTSKPIFVQPFWVNTDIWKPISNKQNIRKKYNIDKDCFLIGSFQRDTEGHDLKSPKLEKGPDLLFECIKQQYEKDNNTKVLLAGWRRQYIINRLKEEGIEYYYFELPDFKTINELYNCLDLYVVSARYEGGPQSIVECAATETPIVSTDVGVASEILHEKSIFKVENFLKAKHNTEYARENIENIIMPKGFDPFLKLFRQICNERRIK